MGQNPIEFETNSIVVSVYTGIRYKVGSMLKYGLRSMINMRTEREETWNAYNNAHFVLENELSLGVISLL